MTKGFTIKDILSPSSRSHHAPSFGQKFGPGSNYMNNIALSYKQMPYNQVLNPFGGHDGHKKTHHSPFGTTTSMFQGDKYNDQPMMLCTKSREAQRAPAFGKSSSNNKRTDNIPIHKMGQVEATRKSKPRKTQTVFSSHQLAHLETKYRNNNYITTEERNSLAKDLSMTVPQVKNWFQNKRNKERKLGKAPNRNHLNLGTPGGMGDYRMLFPGNNGTFAAFRNYP